MSSLFRKPKKTIQRRVFSCGDGEDEEMNVDNSDKFKSSEKDRKSDKKNKEDGKLPKKNSLLSFDDEGVCILWCSTESKMRH